MERIRDRRRIEEVLDAVRAEHVFGDMHGLPLYAVAFAPGEIVGSIISPNDHLLFVLDGRMAIYALDTEGSRMPLCRFDAAENGIQVLGDIEFCLPGRASHVIEVESAALAVVLPLATCRERLESDASLLRFLMKSLAIKLELSSREAAERDGLDRRLLRYMEQGGREGLLERVGVAAEDLRCSRRQLQRVLARLCDRGVLEHCGHGRYVLANR